MKQFVLLSFLTTLCWLALAWFTVYLLEQVAPVCRIDDFQYMPPEAPSWFCLHKEVVLLPVLAAVHLALSAIIFKISRPFR